MKKIFLIVSFLILITTTAFAVIENKAGEVIGQMGTTFNERNGKTEKVEKEFKPLVPRTEDDKKEEDRKVDPGEPLEFALEDG